jgi:hypothetical protein
MTTLEPLPHAGQGRNDEARPVCVYCDKAMRLLLTDRLARAATFSQFVCDGCGWEVAVPFE